MMHHQMRFILICSFLCATIAASKNKIIDIPKDTKQQSTEELTLDDDISSSSSSSSRRSDISGVPFETSHKAPHRNDYQTSHKISIDALQQRDELHQSMKSKEKPELDEQLAELIAADIRNNIEAKRLSEYEKYVIEPLTTTEKPVLTTTEEGIAQSINDGLIDEYSVLDEAGTEKKQESRIQIKKGPDGKDVEYEYVYYYYDDDDEEASDKSDDESDVIVSNRKPQLTTVSSTTTIAPTVSAGKTSYASIERGSSSSADRNEIQSRGKGRAQALPAPVVEDITDDRLPPATRFPQRGKSASSGSNENVVPENGKKHHPKRPTLELVDSHLFITDEKDKNSQKGPRIIEADISKKELIENMSKSVLEHVSSKSTTTLSSQYEEDEEDTTPSMEKATFDLYAHIVNENVNEDEKKADSINDFDSTTAEIEDLTTARDDCDDCDDSSLLLSTTELPTTTKTTTTKATTTTTTTTEPTTTVAVTEAARGRGGLTAGRTSNRFKFQARTTPEAEVTTEAPKSVKNRFQKPSLSGSRARTTKPAVTQVEEVVEKSEAPQQQSQSQSSSGNKFRSGGARNRFNLPRNTAGVTEKPSVNVDAESTTTTKLVKPRPQFSLRNRGKQAPTEATIQSNTEAIDENEQEKDDKAVEKSSQSSPIAPRPTSRLNINRPGNRITPTAAQKKRPSTINRSRVNSNAESNDDNKSAAENESDAESTTQNNLNKLKSRPRIQINAESKAKKTTVQPLINRKANPLISKRKFGVTSTTEAAVDEQEDNESDNAAKEGAKDVSESANEVKEENTTQAAEVTLSTEQPRGIGILNRRKLAISRKPGSII